MTAGGERISGVSHTEQSLQGCMKLGGEMLSGAPQAEQSLQGGIYPRGRDGVDGVSPVVAVEDIDGGHRLTITDKNGEKTFDVMDGAVGEPGKDGIDGQEGYTPIKGIDYFDGKDGIDGKDGYTPVKGVDYFDGKDGQPGKDGVDGKAGADGYTPVKGTDYFTEADKTEMVAAVKAQLITEQWTLTLMDDTVVTKDVVME